MKQLLTSATVVAVPAAAATVGLAQPALATYTTLSAATLAYTDSAVTDCTAAAPLDGWRTGLVTRKSTGKRPPKELELLAQRVMGGESTCRPPRRGPRGHHHRRADQARKVDHA